MKNKESNKSNKRKLFILILLLFVVIGISGYGAYSYFYTQGSFSGYDTVEIASFNPVADGDFLGHGGTMTLTCPSSNLGEETVNCTGTLDVTNNGGTAITVSTDNATASVNSLSYDDVNATAGDPSFSWTSTTIGVGDTETLTVTVPVTLDSCFGDLDNSCSRDSEYEGEAIEVTVTYTIIAAQVHN